MSALNSISVGVLVAVRREEHPESGPALLLQERGPNNASGSPQSMVGAVQPTAPEQFEQASANGGVVGQAIVEALRQSILPRELGAQFTAAVVEVMDENIRAAGSVDQYLDAQHRALNDNGKLVITCVVDLRKRFTVETARNALQTVVNPSGEISGFVGWNGHSQISVMSEAARAPAYKGMRVIPVDELMAFSDDIQAISNAMDAFGGSSSAGPPDYAEAPSNR
jgi:hypothetical protein